MEAASRAIISMKYGVTGKSYGLWQYDSELGAIHSANAYNSNSETNNLGFRNKEDVIEPKPANAFRVIAYGGSTTFCYNLPTDQAWPIRLQQILRARHNTSDQVLNGGAIMWSISHELVRAKRDLPRLKPDIVIIYSGVNEEANARYLQAGGINLEEPLKDGKSGMFARGLDQEKWVKRNLVMVRYWDYIAAPLLHRPGPAAETTDVPSSPSPTTAAIDPVVSQHFNATLRDFIAQIRANGAKPVYVIVGGLPERGENRRFIEYSRQGAKIASQLGVMVLDSNEIIQSYTGERSALFAESGMHWSETGARLLANFIYERALKGR